jgi:hypothetical protein
MREGELEEVKELMFRSPCLHPIVCAREHMTYLLKLVALSEDLGKKSSICSDSRGLLVCLLQEEVVADDRQRVET